MVIKSPPKSSSQRVRAFRKRNPGYDARYQATRRASAKRDAAILKAKLSAIAEAEQAAANAEPLALPAPVEVVEIAAARREPLMLPAPAEVLVFPGLNTPVTFSAGEPVKVPVERSRAA